MKKITLLAALFIGAAAHSQITYESGDYATANEEFLISQASGFIGMNFAATGENHTWDYSGLDADSQAPTSWQDPNDAGYKLSWCLSHLYIFNCNSQFNNNFTHSKVVMDGMEIMDYGLTNVVEHSRVNSSSFAHRMRGMTATVQGISLPLTVDYDNPDEVYNFPMVFGDNYTTDGHFSLDLSNFNVPFSYDLTTERTNTVEGWGSVTTPYGTFPNVLKIKTVLEKTETIAYQDISIPISTTTISYQWFDKEFGVPVLQAEGFQVFGFFVPISVQYLDGPQCLQPAADFVTTVSDYNPETGAGMIAFTNMSANYDSASWDFGDGNSASGFNLSHAYDCPGTYNVTLTIGNSICQPDATATVTIPVTIADPQNALTTSVTVAESTLTADRSVAGTTYQWVDCDNGNAPIEGATSQVFSPVSSGNYACMMNTNGCEGMSECTALTILGSGNYEIGQVQLYPNPTTGLLQLSSNSLTNVKVAVYNSLGMLVANGLDISAQAQGIYFVKITAAEGTFVRKVVKQ